MRSTPHGMTRVPCQGQPGNPRTGYRGQRNGASRVLPGACFIASDYFCWTVSTATSTARARQDRHHPKPASEFDSRPWHVSACLWCDIGQHPFPAGQPGSTTVTVRQHVANQWGGTQPHDVPSDVCAACAKDQGLRRNVAAPTPEAQDRAAEALRDRQGGISLLPAIDAPGKSRFRVRNSEPLED